MLSALMLPALVCPALACLALVCPALACPALLLPALVLPALMLPALVCPALVYPTLVPSCSRPFWLWPLCCSPFPVLDLIKPVMFALHIFMSDLYCVLLVEWLSIIVAIVANRGAQGGI